LDFLSAVLLLCRTLVRLLFLHSVFLDDAACAFTCLSFKKWAKAFELSLSMARVCIDFLIL
jgi:hypothetical protein